MRKPNTDLARIERRGASGRAGAKPPHRTAILLLPESARHAGNRARAPPTSGASRCREPRAATPSRCAQWHQLPAPARVVPPRQPDPTSWSRCSGSTMSRPPVGRTGPHAGAPLGRLSAGNHGTAACPRSLGPATTPRLVSALSRSPVNRRGSTPGESRSGSMIDVIEAWLRLAATACTSRLRPSPRSTRRSAMATMAPTWTAGSRSVAATLDGDRPEGDGEYAMAGAVLRVTGKTLDQHSWRRLGAAVWHGIPASVGCAAVATAEARPACWSPRWRQRSAASSRSARPPPARRRCSMPLSPP